MEEKQSLESIADKNDLIPVLGLFNLAYDGLFNKRGDINSLNGKLYTFSMSLYHATIIYSTVGLYENLSKFF